MHMRRPASILLLVLVLASASTAQFVPCKFGEATAAERRDGIAIRHVDIIEPSGAVRATVLVPDSVVPVPGIVFSYSAIQGNSSRTDLVQFAHALARAGAASIVVDGTIQWLTPNDDSKPSPHLLDCAGEWLLANANLDAKRLASAGPLGGWGGGTTPNCMAGETLCWHPRTWLNFGQATPAEYLNTEKMLTVEGELRMAHFIQRDFKLGDIRPEWLAEPKPDHGQ